jgi:hypothetical protein
VLVPLLELDADASGVSVFAGGGVAAVSVEFGRENRCQARPPRATATRAGISQPDRINEGLCAEDAE